MVCKIAHILYTCNNGLNYMCILQNSLVWTDLFWKFAVHDDVIACKHYSDVIFDVMASQNHQPHDWLINCLFRCRSKKTSNVRVTGLCAGNSPVTGEFPTQMASNVENVSIWWRHHDFSHCWQGAHWLLVGSSHKGPMMWSVDLSRLQCVNMEGGREKQIGTPLLSYWMMPYYSIVSSFDVSLKCWTNSWKEG